MKNKRLAHNALANVAQTVLGACLLFALYRYINTSLGVDQLGVWSVVLAAASASRLADFGLSTGVIRFVARDCAQNKQDRAGKVIDTTFLTLMVSTGAILPLLYPLLAKLLPHLFRASYLPQALAILPYALISLWLTIVATVFQGGLDGCQRMDLRAGLVLTGQALLLIMAFWSVPRYGLLGLAWAQVGQGVFLVVGGRLLLRRILPELPRLPLCWRKDVLREMLGYGANVQAATVFMLLCDPVANALMARFGGPSAAGYFTMANQAVLKARGVLVIANRAVVPHVAELSEAMPHKLDQVYHKNMRVLALVVLPSFALLYAWAGGFSWLLSGAYHTEFVFLFGVLILSWGVNIFSAPAYFTNMGTGQVGWNTISHATTGMLNVGLGFVLGRIYGVYGVAIAYSIALATGSGILIAIYQSKRLLGRYNWFSIEDIGLLIACAFVVIVSWIKPLQPNSGATSITLSLIISPLMLGLAVWLHPMRRRIFGWLTSGDRGYN